MYCRSTLCKVGSGALWGHVPASPTPPAHHCGGCAAAGVGGLGGGPAGWAPQSSWAAPRAERAGYQGRALSAYVPAAALGGRAAVLEVEDALADLAAPPFPGRSREAKVPRPSRATPSALPL